MKKIAATKRKRVVAAAGVLCLLLALLWPVTVQAATEEIRDVDIAVELQEDGSAYITEVWDVSIEKGTEYYLTHYNLDNMRISEFTVTDETGRVFEDVGSWDTELTRQQKAYKSGLVRTSGGYELCWGFGEYGNHKYTLRYKMTNLVKGYNEADALTYVFLTEGEVAPQHVKVSIRKEGTPFSYENTGVWAFRYTGRIDVVDGAVVAETSQRMRTSDSVRIMVEFNKGMFAPADVKSKNFADVKKQALKGSDYTEENDGPKVVATNNGGAGLAGGEGSGGSGSGTGNISSVLGMVVPFLVPMGVTLSLPFLIRKNKGGTTGKNTPVSKTAYRDVPYSRELPWQGSLQATYARLQEINQLSNEGVVIGAYLLRWVRNRQVELVKQQAGFFGNKEEDAIQLYMPREGMNPDERGLYDMLLQAAGEDQILQSKEFEKWSRSHYETVQGWLLNYRKHGLHEIRQKGGSTVVQKTLFFGLFPYNKAVMTPLGEQYTTQMMGFKKYLEEFTIINERQAREVQLWDEYLVFAQVFGIADTVAEQFRMLYPDYFHQIETQMGMGYNMYDIMLITRIANNYSRAAYNGYRAGYSAAHSSRSSGGGGFSSSGGGGGGFSGGGGGRGSR